MTENHKATNTFGFVIKVYLKKDKLYKFVNKYPFFIIDKCLNGAIIIFRNYKYFPMLLVQPEV